MIDRTPCRSCGRPLATTAEWNERLNRAAPNDALCYQDGDHIHRGTLCYVLGVERWQARALAAEAKLAVALALADKWTIAATDDDDDSIYTTKMYVEAQHDCGSELRATLRGEL